jgi:hypothetical protein
MRMAFTHTPRLPIIIWALFTIPFTIWDALYIFLRPYSLLGQKWHSPFFDFMDNWSAVDHVYGVQAWEDNEGWTAAQGVINVLVEVGVYGGYLVILWVYGRGGKGFLGGFSGETGGRSGGMCASFLFRLMTKF